MRCPTMRFPLFSALAVMCAFPLFAQTVPVNPAELVRQMVEAELKPDNGDRSHWSYELTHTDPRLQEVRHCVDTDMGLICRVISRNGSPLSDSEQKKEQERIARLAGDPSEQYAQQKDRARDAEKAARFMKMLPSAFLYQEDGREGNCIRLKFSPNPGYDASGWESRVFHAMAGTMWIDATQKRLVHLKGELVSTVEFGGGLLGRLEKGGRFEVQRVDLGHGHWETSYLDVHIDGKALCFKTIRAQQTEVASHFQHEPESISIAQAARLLAPAE